MARVPFRRFCRLAGGVLLLVLGVFQISPARAQAAAIAPIPAGAARFWFYRVFFPDDTKSMPAIAMNGATVGYALAGASFYRDVPAGSYSLTVQSVGIDYYQSANVSVGPGQEVYVKIDSQPDWVENLGNGYRAGTYYVRIVPPQLAARELQQTTYSHGG